MKLLNMYASGKRPGASARHDALWVVLLPLLAFLVAGRFELQEKLTALTARWETWQLDELPLALLALSASLAWYAWRRRREAAEMLLHNRELAQRLLQLQDQERMAIARELHDELGQHCTALRMEAAYLARVQDTAQVHGAARRVASSAELLHEGVRRLLRRLRPAELDELGLPAALRSLCDSWESRSCLRCTLTLTGAAQSLGDVLDTALYRVTQEALSNAVRHAHAQHVHITLDVQPDSVRLCVHDDGCGIDLTRSTRGLGLLGASERAAALGGRFEIAGTPGAGTRLQLLLPRSDAGQAQPQSLQLMGAAS
jgi:glucose-6-phosphate-specific signal transduction histidine kinase